MLNTKEILKDIYKLRAAYANRGLWAEAKVVDLIINRITMPTAEDEETNE